MHIYYDQPFIIPLFGICDERGLTVPGQRPPEQCLLASSKRHKIISRQRTFACADVLVALPAQFDNMAGDNIPALHSTQEVSEYLTMVK